jgi:hypothetical protein
LREGHAQELIQTRETFDVAVALVLQDGTTKRVQWQMLHELGEHVTTLVHGDILRRISATVTPLSLKSVTRQKCRSAQSNQAIARIERDFLRTVLARAKKSHQKKPRWSAPQVLRPANLQSRAPFQSTRPGSEHALSASNSGDTSNNGYMKFEKRTL